MAYSRFALSVSFSFSLLLAACGGGGSSSAPGTVSPVSPANTAPTISGTPPASVDEGTEFTFIPTASDADDDTLTFSVTNLPAWAGFDEDSGEISGTPSRENAGQYSDISISVSDGTDTSTLPAFSLQVLAVREITLQGKATDSPLSHAEIAVRVGEEEYTATSTEDGNYSLRIVLRDGDYQPKQILTISARGTDGQEHIELVSQVTSFENIISLASDDEVLAADAFHRLNITQLSTARYLLAKDKNAGVAASSDPALTEAESAVSGEQLIELAGMIKLLADHQTYGVMDGKTTLTQWQTEGQTNWQTALQWQINKGYRDESGFLTEAFNSDLAEAIQLSIEDTNVVAGFSTEALSGEYVLTKAVQSGWSAATGEVISIGDNLSGRVYTEMASAHNRQYVLNWEKQEDKLRLIYPQRYTEVLADPVNQANYDYLYFDYGFSWDVVQQAEQNPPIQMLLDKQIVSEDYVLLYQVGSAWMVHKTQSVQYSVDAVSSQQMGLAEPPKSTKTYITSHLMYPVDSNASWPEDVALNGTWALPLKYELAVADSGELSAGYYADKISINDSHIATGLLSEMSLAAEMDQHSLILSSETERYIYTPFAYDGQLYSALVRHYKDEQLQNQFVNWIVRTEEVEPALVPILQREFPEVMVAGNHWEAEKYQPDSLLAVNQVRAYQINESMQARRVYGVGEAQTARFFIDNGWFYTGTGSTGELTKSSSLFEQRREWIAIDVNDDNRLLVIDALFERFDMDGSGTFDADEKGGYVSMPFIRVLRPVDLQNWQQAWENSDLD